MKVSHQERYRVGKKVTFVGATVNLFLSVIKVLFGVFGRSPALVADGIHSLSDLICDFLVLVASKYASVEADDNHPYGHRRYETFATFLIGLFLILVGAGIGYEAASHIALNITVSPNWMTAVVAVISIVSNEGLYRYTMLQANRVDSNMLRANAEHSRGDMLSSVIVLIGILGAIAGWTFLDAVAAIIVGLMILKMGAKWCFRALHELSDAGLDAKRLTGIKAIINETEGVLHMHQLRTRKMAEQVFLDVHIEVPPYTSASEGHYIAEVARVKLMKTYPEIADVTIHVDIEDHPEGLPDKMLQSRQALLARYQTHWSEIVPLQAIKRVSLYYVGYRIEIELGVSFTWWQGQSQTIEALQSALAQTVKEDKEVRKLTVMFLPD